MPNDRGQEAGECVGWDYVRELWSGRIKPVRPRFVGPEFPERDRRFLIEVGLPTDTWPLDYVFYHDELLGRPVDGLPGLLAVGAEGAIPIMLDRSDGSVWYMLSAPYLRTFVNSDLPTFLAFLEMFRVGSTAAADTGEENVVVWRRIRARYAELDPAAVATRTATMWGTALAEAERDVE